MADIFISYSRKDSEQVLPLVERLRGEGLEIWIDLQGLEAATSWGKEIANALEGCKIVVLMISPSSVASENVAKELSVAARLKKRIIPVQVEPVEMQGEFLYHLARLQRVPITEYDAIVKAIKNPSKEFLPPQKEKDFRKTLMILPFEDLSPTGDNEWFANGIVSEIISLLSNVKALRLTDGQTTKEYKNYKGQLTVYAKEMDIRYFVQGDVRKFGDNVKITSRLLDIETGDHLWQDSLKGTMDDIFDIQEKVAGSVVEGLKIHLASDEKKKLSERGTENAEAYELFLKANEYLVLYTKESMKHALNLYGEAIKLDPNYADAYSEKAYGLSMFFRSYDRDPKLLDEAESLAKQALNIKPDHWRSYGPLAHIYQFQGKLTQAEETAKEFVRKAPESDRSHFVLAYFYGQTGQPAKAIAPLEEAMRLVPDSLATLQNLVFACDEAGETEKCTYWAMVAIPLVEKYLRLHPDDEIRRVQHAILLFHAKRMADARTAVRALSDIKDGANLFNLGLLLVHFEEFMDAIATFRKSFETGFVIDVEGFRRDHDLDPLRSMPEFEELVKELEEKQNA